MLSQQAPKVRHFSTSMQSSQENPSKTPLPGEQQEESRQQPVWHVFVLNIFTMFAYSIVWFFKNWYQLSAYNKLDEKMPDDDMARTTLKSCANKNAYWQTFGLLVPFWQLFLTTGFFADTISLYPGEIPLAKKFPLLGGAVMTAALAALLSLYRLPGIYYLLYLLASIPLATAQYMLNRFWSTCERPGLLVRQAFSVSELIAMIFGSLFLGLVVTGIAIQH